MKKIYFKGLVWFNNVKENISEKWNDEEGAGVIELAIIVLILVGLAIVFKSEIDTILTNIIGDFKGKIPTL